MFKTIHNQDPNNLHYSIKEALQPKHVDAMIDNIAASGVDAILVCPNAEVANHPSNVIGTYEDMFDGEPAAKTVADVPQAYWDTFANDKRQYMSLKNAGCDYLTQALTRSRQQKLVPGISVRMNDMHGGSWLEAPSHGPFFKTHPDCRIMVNNHCLGLDYQKPEVRKLMLDYVRELKQNYDFDLLELDWIRFQSHFYPGKGYENRHSITDFMTEIRDILGSNITLMVRVHARPAGALNQGLDVAEWANQGLIDIVSPASFFSLRLEFPIKQYRQLTNDKVKIFACIDDTDSTGKSLLEEAPELARGALAGAFAAGSTGIEFFNQFFKANTADPRIKRREDLLADLSSSKTFEGQTKRYRTDSKPRCWVANCDYPWQVPAEINFTNSKQFNILAAKTAITTSCKLELHVKGESEASEWQAAINNYPAISPATKVQLDQNINIFTFEIEPKAMLDGTNNIHVHNSSENTKIIQSVELYVEQ